MADELITRPPSHPTANALLIACMIGTIMCISFTGSELYGEYLPSAEADPAGAEFRKKHDPVAALDRDEPLRDHYRVDFPGNMLDRIRTELDVGEVVGEISGSGGGRSGGGSAAPIEAPDDE